MTKQELDKIRARCEAATEGPWHTMVSLTHSHIHCEDEHNNYIGLADGMMRAEPNGVFIAHARTDVPALLDEVKRLRSELEKIEDVGRTRSGRTAESQIAFDALKDRK